MQPPRRVGPFTSLALLAVLAVPLAAQNEPAFTTITFPSADGLLLTADYYRGEGTTSTAASPAESGGESNEEQVNVPDVRPLIVLFHQAGWSRGEYREIAPKLVAMGFDCLAVDARSGEAVAGVDNLTALRATEADQPTTYVDAEQDLIAALRHARSELSNGDRVIAWGSSYSSALVLRIAGENPGIADAVLSFAPGEYFSRLGKPRDWITKSAAKIRCPVFITSAKREVGNWQAIFAAIPEHEGMARTKFVPETAGNHGSRALWERFDDHEAYWTAVTDFLKPYSTVLQERAGKDAAEADAPAGEEAGTAESKPTKTDGDDEKPGRPVIQTPTSGH